MELSHALKMKIITSKNESINIEQHYNEICGIGSCDKISVPSYKEIKLTLNLRNDLELYKECIRWSKLIMDNYSSKMKVDIGRFKGLFPIEIGVDSIVTFTADEFDDDNENWKDWFVMEEENENRG